MSVFTCSMYFYLSLPNNLRYMLACICMQVSFNQDSVCGDNSQQLISAAVGVEVIGLVSDSDIQQAHSHQASVALPTKHAHISPLLHNIHQPHSYICFHNYWHRSNSLLSLFFDVHNQSQLQSDVTPCIRAMPHYPALLLEKKIP